MSWQWEDLPCRRLSTAFTSSLGLCVNENCVMRKKQRNVRNKGREMRENNSEKVEVKTREKETRKEEQKKIQKELRL